ncbi:MAG: response regulator [Spirochaetaceae bacterium]|nr:response regulator [Spirochaetaceae bacterium]
MSNLHIKKKHILLISGDPRTLAEIKMELMDHFDISISAASETALDALEMYEVSAVLIYIGESREKAFSVFTSIFESIKNKNIPIIFLAEKGSDVDESTAFAMGAVDYSARRHGTTNALISRINLRISASEYERRALNEEETTLSRDGVPEAVLIGKTILIVDDLDINREIVASMLSGIEDLTFVFAENGKEAVEKFASDPNLYAFILMDVQMPEMDGLAATKAIRHLDDCKNAREIPIIAMTAGVSEDEIALCLEAGMDDYLEKPMAYDKLLAVAAEHCL